MNTANGVNESIAGLDPVKLYRGLAIRGDEVVCTQPEDNRTRIHLVQPMGHLVLVDYYARSQYSISVHDPAMRRPRDQDRLVLTQSIGETIACSSVMEFVPIGGDMRMGWREADGQESVVQPDLAELTAARVIGARILTPRDGQTLARLVEEDFDRAVGRGNNLFYADPQTKRALTFEMLAAFAQAAVGA